MQLPKHVPQHVRTDHAQAGLHMQRACTCTNPILKAAFYIHTHKYTHTHLQHRRQSPCKLCIAQLVRAKGSCSRHHRGAARLGASTCAALCCIAALRAGQGPLGTGLPPALLRLLLRYRASGRGHGSSSSSGSRYGGGGKHRDLSGLRRAQAQGRIMGAPAESVHEVEQACRRAPIQQVRAGHDAPGVCICVCARVSM